MNSTEKIWVLNTTDSATGMELCMSLNSLQLLRPTTGPTEFCEFGGIVSGIADCGRFFVSVHDCREARELLMAHTGSLPARTVYEEENGD